MIASQEQNRGLTIIVPVTKMSGKLNNLRAWIKDSLPYKLQVILIHDERDIETTRELAEVINQQQEMHIQLVNGKFGSPGATRNIGLNLIKYDWVAFWDADDLPQINNVMRELGQVNSADCVVGNFQITDLASDVTKSVEFSDRFSDDVGLNPGLWRFVFKSESIKYLNFENFLMGEDQVFLANYFLISRKVQTSSEIFYQYFVGNSDQLTRNEKAISELPQAMEAIAKLFKVRNENLRMSLIIFTRMFLTSLKRGNFSCKFQALKEWLKICTYSNFNIKFGLSRAIWTVLKNAKG